jgi:hypothetical protein
VHDQRLARELVEDVQELDRVPVGGLIELEVERPQVARAFGPQTPLRRRRGAPAGALRCGTLRPSSRRRRCTRLRLSASPHPARWVCAWRSPQRGRAAENARGTAPRWLPLTALAPAGHRAAAGARRALDRRRRADRCAHLTSAAPQG